MIWGGSRSKYTNDVQVTNWTIPSRVLLAEQIVDTMNNLIESFEGGEFCALLSPLNDTETAMSIRRNLNQANLFKIQITVSPSNGLFEIYARSDPSLEMNKWELETEMVRLNEYGNQGDCVLHLDPALRPLCFCVNSNGTEYGSTTTSD